MQNGIRKCFGTIHHENFTTDAKKIHFWLCVQKFLNSALAPPVLKIALRVQNMSFLGICAKKLLKVLGYHLLWKLHYGCKKVLFLGIYVKILLMFFGTTFHENGTTDAKKIYFWVSMRKSIKKSSIPPLMKIAQLMQKKSIFMFVYKIVVKSAPYHPVMIITPWMHENSLFEYMCKIVVKIYFVQPCCCAFRPCWQAHG